MKQTEAFSIIHDAISKIRVKKAKPIRVAINGIEGTGKTTFARALATYLKAQNLTVFHVSIDGFHVDKKTRYRQGRDSGDGYYEDSYDESAFVENVLQRSQQTPAEYIEAIHDLETDRPLPLEPKTIPDNAVLLTDGSYLFKPIFEPHWDLKVYLHTDFDTASERGALRDKDHLGGYEAAKRKFATRYHFASRRYLAEIGPLERADLVFDATDFDDLIFDVSVYEIHTQTNPERPDLERSDIFLSLP